MAYTICTSCKIHHIENCGTCFGFGVTSSGAPVSAGDAYDRHVSGWSPCPECGSMPMGVPSGATKWTRHKLQRIGQ